MKQPVAPNIENLGGGIRGEMTLHRPDSDAIRNPLPAGFSRRTRVNEAALADASQIWYDFMRGALNPAFMQEAFHPGSDPDVFNVMARRYPAVFNEAISIGTFSALTDQILDRQIMDSWPSQQGAYEFTCRINPSVKDFRARRVYTVDGMQDVYEHLPEFHKAKLREPSMSSVDVSVAKYGAGFAKSWEAMVNDDLDFFRSLPGRLVQGGKFSIQKYVTQLYMDSSGPLSTIYSSGNGNIITSNPTFSMAALETALAQMAHQTDAEGLPISLANGIVVEFASYGDYIQALNVKRGITVDLTTGAGGTTRSVRTPLWAADKFEPVFNPWLRLIDTTHTNAWYIFSNPTSGRPALLLDFLAGFSAPQLFRKAPNTMSASGGVVESMGDFDTMTTEYKAMIVYGGVAYEPKATMASNGTNS